MLAGVMANILECWEILLVSNLEGHNQFLLQIFKLLLSITINLGVEKRKLQWEDVEITFNCCISDYKKQKEDKHWVTHHLTYTNILTLSLSGYVNL